MLLYMNGFEAESALDVNQLYTGKYGSGGCAVNIVSDYKRTGTYSCRVIDFSDVNGTVTSSYYANLDCYPPNVVSNTIYMGLGIRVYTRDANQDYYMRTDTGYLQIGRSDGSFLITLSFNSSQQIQAYSSRTGTVLATSSQTFALNTWYWYQMRLIADSVNGRFTLYVGNVELMDITSINTSMTSNIPNYVRIHSGMNKQSSGVPPVWLWVDDIVFMDNSGSNNNAFPIGVKKIIGTLPNADGDMTDLTASTGSPYACIDEYTGSNTDYIYASAINKVGLFNFSDITTYRNINGIQYIAYSGRSDNTGISTANVHCYPNNCLSTFNDIRFVKSDGTTLLNYWIESVSGSTPSQVATMQVKFDSIDTTDTTFYMLFNDSTATAYSNGQNTMIFQEDFDSSYDNTQNVEGGTWTRNDTGGYGNSGHYACAAEANAQHSYITFPDTSNGWHYRMRIYFDSDVNFGGGIIIGNPTTTYMVQLFPASNQISHYDNASNETKNTSTTINGTTQYLMDYYNDENGNQSIYIDGSLKISNTDTAITTQNKLRIRKAETTGVRFDTIFMRKYRASEPTITWGFAETGTYLTDQTNRIPFTVKRTAGAVTDYQIQITVGESELGTSHWKPVYRDATDQENLGTEQTISSTWGFKNIIYEKNPISNNNQTDAELVDMQQGFKTIYI